MNSFYHKTFLSLQVLTFSFCVQPSVAQSKHTTVSSIRLDDPYDFSEDIEFNDSDSFNGHGDELRTFASACWIRGVSATGCLDISSLKNNKTFREKYEELSGRDIDEMLAGGRHHPIDFLDPFPSVLNLRRSDNSRVPHPHSSAIGRARQMKSSSPTLEWNEDGVDTAWVLAEHIQESKRLVRRINYWSESGKLFNCRKQNCQTIVSAKAEDDSSRVLLFVCTVPTVRSRQGKILGAPEDCLPILTRGDDGKIYIRALLALDYFHIMLAMGSNNGLPLGTLL